MPKVTEKYVTEKKNLVLDAAFVVVARKPLFAVTMQDIINETGFSQGAVYRYYDDIDDILIAVLNKFYQPVDLKKEVETLFNTDDIPENILRSIFDCLAQYMGSTLPGYGKISLELSMIYAAYPERALKFRNSLIEQDGYTALLTQCFQFINEKVECGYFAPAIPLNDIIAFAVSSYDGITRNVTMQSCYDLDDSLPARTQYNAVTLLKTLCETILYLLGASAKESRV